MTTSNEDLKRTIRLTLASTQINAWEREFLRGILGKLELGTSRATLTEKQYSQVMKVTRPKRKQVSTIDAQFSGNQNIRPKPKFPFRNNKSRGRFSLVILGVGALATLFFVVFKAVERFPEHLGPIVAATSVYEIAGRVTYVRDGDTIEVENVPIRFGSLDCEESSTDAGQRATTTMRSLVQSQSLTCYLNGRKSYDRAIGSCRLSDDRDLASLMIDQGYCKRYW